jgi:cellulose synthase/poly-beta-1,6-N-acetylglucosamine synthase-like glycosyltransferase
VTPFITILVGSLTAYLTFSVLYLLFFAVAGRINRRPERASGNHHHRMAVLVPAYREDEVIVASSRSLLAQDYPSDDFEVVIIADGLQPQTLSELRRLDVKVIEADFEQSTKAKALNLALNTLPRDHFDLAVVMDADNIVPSNFLTEVNLAFAAGAQVVQAHRTAKNLDTTMAVLDGISEEINNHIFRKGHRVVGLSAALVGSGMAFRYGLFHSLMQECRAVGGFDKELELALTSRGITIEYLDHVDVWDEKVDRPNRFVGQRRRWLAAQAHYALQGVKQLGTRSPFDWTIDHVDKTVQMFLPPRAVLIAVLPVLTVLFALVSTGPALWYGLLSIVLILTLVLAFPASFGRGLLLRALVGLPKALLLMAVAMLRSFGANRRFIHTGHGPQTVADQQATS